jgi:hypothetical protein
VGTWHLKTIHVKVRTDSDCRLAAHTSTNANPVRALPAIAKAIAQGKAKIVTRVVDQQH